MRKLHREISKHANADQDSLKILKLNCVDETRRTEF
jgi:hypothetical protein